MNLSEEPAFPMIYDGPSSFCHNGLNKREYFAGLALQGFLSNSAHMDTFSGNSPLPIPNEIVKYSIECADELLRQLEL